MNTLRKLGKCGPTVLEFVSTDFENGVRQWWCGPWVIERPDWGARGSWYSLRNIETRSWAEFRSVQQAADFAAAATPND